jgi:hypothetical protein
MIIARGFDLMDVNRKTFQCLRCSHVDQPVNSGTGATLVSEMRSNFLDGPARSRSRQARYGRSASNEAKDP